MSGEDAVIVNITEQSYAAYRTYGTFQIAGRVAVGTSLNSGPQGSTSQGNPQHNHAPQSGTVDSNAQHSNALHGDVARSDVQRGNLPPGDAPRMGGPTADDVPYAVTRVTPRTAVMDYGDKRVLPLPIGAREIAEDLCREINSDAGENSFLGVFVCAGAAPTGEELRAAQSRLEEFYRSLVAAADREWERSHSFLFINDLQRRAAAALGVEKEWYPKGRATAECPGCGERVKPGVAVCKSCGAILDREKALALGLAQPLLQEASPALAAPVQAVGNCASEKCGARLPAEKQEPRRSF